MSDHENDQHGEGAPPYNAHHFPANNDPAPGFQPARFPGNPPNPTPSPPPDPHQNPGQQLPNPPYIIQYNQPRHMPSRYDRNAPKFDGNPRSLKRFFEDIEVLARDCGTAPDEQIAQTLRYLDGNDYDTWRMRPSAAGDDWDTFKQDIINLYPGANDNSRYSVTDLELFAERHAATPMRDQTQFGLYFREFLTRSGWLRTRNLISARERNKLFLNGFHIDFRNQLRTQLRLQEPLHPLDEPWNIGFVEQAAWFLLDGMIGGNVLVLPPPVASPTAPHQYNPPAPPPTLNPSPRPTFDMSSIEQILMSDAFLNRLASRIPTPSSGQQYPPPNTTQPRTQWPCGMCSNTQHMFRNCPTLDDYLRRGLCKRDSSNRICVPDGTQITPQLAAGRNMKERIDNWLQAHPRTAHVQTNMIEVSVLPPIISNNTPSTSSMPYSIPPTSPEDEEIARLEAIALAAMKRQDEIWKRNGNAGKGRSPPNGTNAPVSAAKQASPPKQFSSNTPQTQTSPQPPQFRFASPIEDAQTVQNVIQRSLDGTVTLTQKELYAIAPDIRKHIKEQVTTHRVPTGQPANMSVVEEAIYSPQTTSLSVMHHHSHPSPNPIIVANHVEDLRTIRLELSDKVAVDAILDEGSQIIGVRRDIWERLGLPLLKDENMVMETANSSKETTLGLLRDLPARIGNSTFYLQVQVFENAPYEMLLGRPFLTLTQAKTHHYQNGDSHITLLDPNSQETITIPTSSRVRGSAQSSRLDF